MQEENERSQKKVNNGKEMYKKSVLHVQKLIFY